MQQSDYITVSEMSARTGLSQSAIRTALLRGRLAYIEVYGRKLVASKDAESYKDASRKGRPKKPEGYFLKWLSSVDENGRPQLKAETERGNYIIKTRLNGYSTEWWGEHYHASQKIHPTEKDAKRACQHHFIGEWD